MNPGIETFLSPDRKSSAINGKRFPRFTRIGVNGTGTGRPIVKRVLTAAALGCALLVISPIEFRGAFANGTADPRAAQTERVRPMNELYLPAVISPSSKPTVSNLIDAYKADPYSRYRVIRYATRANYDNQSFGAALRGVRCPHIQPKPHSPMAGHAAGNCGLPPQTPASFQGAAA